MSRRRNAGAIFMNKRLLFALGTQKGGRSRLLFDREIGLGHLGPAAAGSLGAVGDLCSLESANVLGLPTFGALGHGEFNRLAFLQAAVSVGLNRGEMHEDIFSSLTRDKTKDFSGVEPLNCSLFHFVFS